MPSCCIKQCKSRKGINQPTLTFHRFPSNENNKRKWLEIIGTENLKPKLKSLYVCSKHFDETSFNRTLDVVRLRDGAVPISSHKSSQICTVSTLESTLNSHSSSSTMMCNLPTSDTSYLILPENQEYIVEIEQILLKKNKELTNLTKKYDNLRRKVKQLNEKVRRRDKKIALLTEIMKDLQKRNLLNSEQSLVLDECTGLLTVNYS